MEKIGSGMKILDPQHTAILLNRGPGEIGTYDSKSTLRLPTCVADPDPGFVKKLRIQDEHPGSYFRELRNNTMMPGIRNHLDP
jgi:hypothetical protein